jgi:Outer membrane protein beta-barrel domain
MIAKVKMITVITAIAGTGLAIARGLACGLASIALVAIAFAPATAEDSPPPRLERFEAASNEAAMNEAATSEASPRKAVEQDAPREHRPAAPAAREPLYSIDAHIQFGRLSQTARDSFAAILGNSSGQVFGAGAELAFRHGVFVRADVSYFRDDGERVEMVDGEIVPLGIPVTLSLTPIEFSGGYRFSAFTFGRRGQLRLVPFVGAGAGVVRFREETDDEHPDESTSERFTSYHVLVGLDVPLGKRVAIGGELTRRWVRDGLGSGGISQSFGETDLGGTTMWTRVRVMF